MAQKANPKIALLENIYGIKHVYTPGNYYKFSVLWGRLQFLALSMYNNYNCATVVLTLQ